MTAARLRRGRPHGFTLVELLVVIFIVTILTAATIPVVLPAIRSQRINLAARTFQAQLGNARDNAIRDNAPRGVRLLPDAVLNGPDGANPGRALAYGRMVGLEAAPDYKEGLIRPGMPNPAGDVAAGGGNFPFAMPVAGLAAYWGPAYFGLPTGGVDERRLIVHEQQYRSISGVAVPNPPTNWYRNVRQGDKLRIASTGRTYTIAGPCPARLYNPATSAFDVPNSERLIDFPAGYLPYFGPPLSALPNDPARRPPEFLWLLNGADDDGDGLADEALDGVNNDGQFASPHPPLVGNNVLLPDPRDDSVDPAYDGAVSPTGIPNFPDSLLEMNEDDCTGEIETEADPNGPTLGMDGPINQGYEYTILRRPVPAIGSSELTLPGDVLIDATGAPGLYPYPTGLSLVGLRSRLPVDPIGRHVDFLLAPNGQVLRAESGANNAPDTSLPFYHFWLAEREDVFDWDPTQYANDGTPPLPITRDAFALIGLSPAQRVLKAERRLISITSRTGQVVANSPERFTTLNNANVEYYDPNAPYYDAQRGARDVK